MENHNHVEEIIHSFESGALEDFEIESFKELEIFSKILFDKRRFNYIVFYYRPRL